MNQQKQVFEDYLTSRDLSEYSPHQGFEHYQKLLSDSNKVVNLISRRMPVENYWLQHFLDSLLVTEIVDFEGRLSGFWYWWRIAQDSRKICRKIAK